MNKIQQQYEGFLATPLLWKNTAIEDLQQFSYLNTIKNTTFSSIPKEKLRLGKLVERFVSFELQNIAGLQILAENIQIQQEKITLGELDCLLSYKQIPIHLEIVYKFYLYDKTVGDNELEHWIGPNRKDALVQKLNKLKQKQFPLLHHKACKNLLNNLNLQPNKIKQQTYFKAQLFVPLTDYGKTFPIVNNNCIYGFYINYNQLELFNTCKFYIPTKHDWLIIPHTHINWLNFTSFKIEIQAFIQEQNATLCWLKQPNGQLKKFFMVWW